MDDLAAAVGSPEVLLANIVRGIEGKMDDDVASNRTVGDKWNTGSSVGPGRVYVLLFLDTSTIRIIQICLLKMDCLSLLIYSTCDSFFHWLCFLFLLCSGVADARMHVLRTKVRIMQEELDQLSSEYYKKVPKTEIISTFTLHRKKNFY